MQSFLDSGPPLSPSGIFNFDGMDGSGNGSNGEDMFRYYLDLQAFQGKEKDNSGMMTMPQQQQQQYQPMAYNNNNNLDNMMIPSTTASSNSSSSLSNSISPYNAFFNPSLYADQQQQQQQQASAMMNTNNNNSSSLFPFAEAAASSSTSYNSNNNMFSMNTVNPASLLSFDHLAGSANPQPIDPNFLVGGGTSTQSQPQPQQQSLPMSSIVPQVKLEEDSDLTSFPQSTSASSFSMTQPTPPVVNATSTTGTSSHHRRSGNSKEREEEDDSEEDDDDDDDEHMSDESEEEALAVVSKKRTARSSNAANGATTSSSSSTANGKKKQRSSATKSSSTSSGSSKKSSSANHQSKKESSVLSVNNGGHPHPHALVPVPDWSDRPTKEVYEKLSSKEKRQMRNKISARNFRHRRKAHIDTLEALVEEKEGVIAVLHEEVGTLRTENQGLRADIEVLKKNWESIAAKIGASTVNTTTAAPIVANSHLSPEEDDLYGAPGSLPALSPAASSSAESTNGDVSELSFEHPNVHAQAQAQALVARPSTSTSSSAASSNGKRVTRSTIRPNLRKDLGPSGASFSSAFGVGRSMNVHTTLIPELNFNFPVPPPSVFSASPPSLTDGTSSNNSLSAPSSNTSQSGGASPVPSFTSSVADIFAGKKDRDVAAPSARLNMNPALNGLSQEQINNLREQFFASAPGFAAVNNNGNNNNTNNNVNVTSGKVARSPLDPLQNSFFDSNPFISLRQDNLQDYRAQLYAKLANNVAGIHQAQQQQQQQSSNGNKAQSPVNGLKPAFFASPAPTQQIQGATAASSSSSAGAANELAMAGSMVTSKDAAEMAKIASIAQKTLFDKLSTAFWDAFSGSQHSTPKGIIPAKPQSQSQSSTSSSSPRRRGSNASAVNVDGQKIADVLAGRSRLQVVKNEQLEGNENVDDLTKKIEGMGLKK